MSRATQCVLLVLLGGTLMSITVSGRFTSYVRPGFGPLLLAAGVILILVGLLSIVLGVRSDLAADAERADEPATPAHSEASGHTHERSRAPWLILAPILVLLLLSPPALGADAVIRNAGSQAVAGLGGVAAASGTGADVAAGGSAGGYAPNDGSGHGMGTKAFATKRPVMAFPALPAGADPTLTLKDFVMRALYDGANSVSDNDTTVIGFIAPAGDGYPDGYSLARMTISCCAADATPMQIHLTGPARYPPNTWVTAVVSAQPGTADAGNDYVPTVDLTSMHPTAQPADPYEH